MKKNIKIAWGVLLIISFLIIGYFNFQNSKPLTEQEKAFLSSQWQSVELILLAPQSGSGIIENKNKSTSKIVDWVEQIMIHQFEWVEPYKGVLPDIPNERLNNSTLLWIDSNNNWVRDDLEVHIVRNYWADNMVIEAFFAYVRSNALNKVIQRDWLFTDELYENDIKLRWTLRWCTTTYLSKSKFDLDSTDRYLMALEFEKYINNTKIRNENAKDFFSNLNNKWWTARVIWDEECLKFLEETKLYKIY